MKTYPTLFAIFIFLFVFTACTSQSATPTVTQPSVPTITLDDERCEYTGPTKIQPDQFSFQWVMNGTKYSTYFIFATQLEEEGHSVNDLIGQDPNSPTPWINTLRQENGTTPGPWTKEVTWDLTQSGRYEPKPVYFVCAHEVNGEIIISGVTGPVEVEN